MVVTRPALANYELAPMQATVIRARDGLDLVSYVTLPPGSDADGDGRPESPLPMVLAVHGGPWARDNYGFHPWHQWLANRGYAVLSVNYRGSTGFGKAFTRAAIREFSGKMHDDLIDGVNWAIGEGIADADKVSIAGGSYGGYATLIGVSFTPDTFACGVDIVGPSSLVTLIESFPEYWKPFLAGTWYTYVGDPENEEDRADMLARSAISRIDDITVPLLVGQGENEHGQEVVDRDHETDQDLFFETGRHSEIATRSPALHSFSASCASTWVVRRMYLPYTGCLILRSGEIAKNCSAISSARPITVVLYILQISFSMTVGAANNTTPASPNAFNSALSSNSPTICGAIS